MRTIGLIAGLWMSVVVFAADTALAQSAPTQKTYVTVDGEVVRYIAGREIVLRGANDEEVAYALSPGTVLSEDVAVGREVKLYTEPGVDGKTQLVTRITTTSITPEGRIERSTKETRKLPSGVTTSTTTTADGEVVRYIAGREIVLRGADDEEVAYALSPGTVLSEDVAIGRKVKLYTEPGVDGKSQLVTRITTTSVTPEGHIKRSTRETRKLPSGVTTSTTTTAVSGTVVAYEVGRTLTLTRSDGSEVTYLIDTNSTVPEGLVIGKAVRIVPLDDTGSDEPVVHTITYVTTSSNKTSSR